MAGQNLPEVAFVHALDSEAEIGTRPVSEILLMMFRSANRDCRKAVKQLEEMKND